MYHSPTCSKLSNVSLKDTAQTFYLDTIKLSKIWPEMTFLKFHLSSTRLFALVWEAVSRKPMQISHIGFFLSEGQTERGEERRGGERGDGIRKRR